jgi:hypothetical protein
VRGAGKDLEGRTRNGALEPRTQRGRVERILSAPHDGRGGAHLTESRRPLAGVAVTERAEVTREGIASGCGGEAPEAGVECEVTALGVNEAAANAAVHETGEQGRRRVPSQGAEGARHPRHSARTHAEGGAAHEGEGGDALRPTNSEGLRDTTAKSVSDDHGVRNAEVIHECADSIGVGAAVGRGGWGIAPTEAWEIDDDEAMAGEKIANEGVPEP